ncbi:MAG: helix-turn-helix domain-containing protein [Bacteroidales bacterium]|nr:helix-turn-helix domain-containing protein [Bacteroidales bacterium]
MKENTNPTLYDIADSFATTTTRSFFLTGKAGTGKTTFLKNLRANTQKQMAVVAPTGVAAINANGMTIHSFFQLPFTPFVPTPEGRLNLIQKAHITRRKRKVIQELELLVIDEVSMVRADVMDEIDTMLRHVRFRQHEPFGGVQVILIGDLYQMAPVAVPEEWAVLAPYYASPYFFDSQVIRKNPLPCVEFDNIFRQKDADFIQILNHIRNNQLTTADIDTLQRQYQPNFDISKHPDYILLTTHNYKADRVNEREMARLPGRETTFKADITGDFPERNYPNAAQLRLKRGARVMFIANDPDHRYFNGKLGEVTDIDNEGKIFVCCDGEEESIEVKHELWTNIRYSVNPETRQIEEEKLGEFQQYPLRPAWAITVHKSQGLTFDHVAVDVEAAFTSGQVYVALSRCRTLEGIALLSRVNPGSLGVDATVREYTAAKPATEVLKQQLEEDRKGYNRQVLLQLFNFSFAVGQIQELANLVGGEDNLFNTGAMSFITPIRNALIALEEVAQRFRRQLDILYQSDDNPQLQERIKAASQYFTEELDKIIDLFESPTAYTEDYDTAEEFRFGLESLYEDIIRKRHVIRHIRRDFSTERCLKLQRGCNVPSLKVKAYRPKRGKKFRDDDFEDNKWEAKGKSRGKRFFEKGKEAKKEPKPAKPKGQTYEITLEMIQSGKSLETIAEERGLTQSTIEGHAARLIGQGRLSINEFFTTAQVEAVRDCLGEGIGLKEIYDALEGNYTYGQLRMIQAAIEAEREG